MALDLKRIDPTLPITAIGKVGNDENGAYVTDVLRKNGVDVNHVVSDTSAGTSLTEVMSIANGQRTFF